MLTSFKRILVAVVVLVVCGGAFLGFKLQQFLETPLTIDNEGIEYQLSKGGSLNSASYELEQLGLISSSQWLRIYSRLSGRGQAVKAGDYWLQSGITPKQLITKFEQGDVRLFQVTLVEGWNFYQLLSALQKAERLTSILTDENLQHIAKELSINQELSIKTGMAINVQIENSSSLLEGWFFPDTYRYHSGDTDLSILKQSHERMKEVLEDEWQNREENLPYKTPYEALVMASIIEKETGAPEERPEIAGVFVRRLQKNMRLQTDPTIIYGLGPNFDGNLKRRHLRDSSNVYNTYRHHGLTPTPIAMPGREAIHAALHPAKGEALYFVAKGDGTHHFSKTLEEHEAAVKKYQIKERRKDYTSSPVQKTFISDNKDAASKQG